MPSDTNKKQDGAEENKQPAGAEEKPEQSKPVSFDEFLGDPKNQSIFDKRVSKAIETARAKWEADVKLSAEERAEKELSDREQAIVQREPNLG